ncbi:hypothetical protein GGI43DRAFT_409855 [Trichoderma evansii]
MHRDWPLISYQPLLSICILSSLSSCSGSQFIQYKYAEYLVQPPLTILKHPSPYFDRGNQIKEERPPSLLILQDIQNTQRESSLSLSRVTHPKSEKEDTPFLSPSPKNPKIPL